MIDIRQTPEYARYIQAIGWSVRQLADRVSGIPPEARLAKGGSCQFFIKKLPLLGNIGKLQRPGGKLDPGKLDELARKHRLAILYIEPSLDTQFTVHDTGYKKPRTCFLPSKTIHIDLKLPEGELLNQMKKNTRYGIRNAKNQGVYVAQSKDINLFVQMWQKSARKRGMWFPLEKEITALWHAFGDKTHILFAHNSKFIIHNSKSIAGVLLVRSPGTACYMYAFSTKEGNRLSAPTLLVWETIKLAKKKGCRIFDFEGIYDERYPQTKNWKGFTRFKEGFGGKTVTYPEALVRYYNPIMRVFG